MCNKYLMNFLSSNAKKFLLLTLIILSVSKTFSQIILIGPTIHYNMGGGEKKFSWGAELSYWNWHIIKGPDAPSIGADIGFEFEKGAIRLYSELQTGMVFGASAGYVYVFSDNLRAGGFQSSIWASVYGGLELRYRRINKVNYLSPGGFLKIPIYGRYPDL
jgi:hypothetical protein